MYASSRRVRGLGYITVPEMLETMYENDLFDMFPVFANVVHILGVIPATLHCVLQNDHSVPLCRLKTYLRSTMGQQRFELQDCPRVLVCRCRVLLCSLT